MNKKSPIVITKIHPSIDCGLYPVKREQGSPMVVRATVFRDGHSTIVVYLKYREKYGKDNWTKTEMALVNTGLDLWETTFVPEKNTRYLYTVEARIQIHISHGLRIQRRSTRQGKMWQVI